MPVTLRQLDTADLARSRTVAPVLRRCGGVRCPDGACDHRDEREPALRRVGTPSSSAVSAAVPGIVYDVLRAPGRPLSGGERRFFEPRFGKDLSRVRVHADRLASRSTRAVDALAYTVGDHVVFGAGRYAPGARAGRHLLAHELAHVVQQRPLTEADVSAGVRIGGPHEAVDEGEADRVADAMTSPGGSRSLRHDGRHAAGPSAGARRPLLARQPESRRSPTAPVAGMARCGPDSTIWFVRTVNAAMSDPVVRMIKVHLKIAEIAASWIGTTAGKAAEAGASAAILAQEERLRLERSAPLRDPTITRQLERGAQSALAVGRGLASPIAPEVLRPLVFALGTAALLWRSLVNHGARFDFKAHKMNKPRTASCPDNCDPGEVGTITLCPGTLLGSCYESDLPGNLFYALIGRHVGWSELTLQLGSQLAELTDTEVRRYHPRVTWDTPQDTAAIRLGYHLPLPLTVDALCAMLSRHRMSLAARHDCAACSEPLPGP